MSLRRRIERVERLIKDRKARDQTLCSCQHGLTLVRLPEIAGGLAANFDDEAWATPEAIAALEARSFCPKCGRKLNRETIAISAWSDSNESVF